MSWTKSRRLIYRFFALSLCASTALAEPLDTTQSFGDYVTGKTIYFHLGDGRVYASESYQNDQRVRWSRIPDAQSTADCIEGRWYAEAGLICFTYDANPTPQCWSVERTANGLVATSDSDVDPLVLYETNKAGPAQKCLGPEVGV